MDSARLFEDEALWQQYIGEVALRRLLPLFLAWVAWLHESGVACPVGARNLEVKTAEGSVGMVKRHGRHGFNTDGQEGERETWTSRPRSGISVTRQSTGR